MANRQNIRSLHPLQFIILPGMSAPAEATKYYETAYQTWKSVWKQTLEELDGSDELFSDHFTRQDYHLTIFHGDRCVAALSFRRVDLHSAADLEDSWLKIWPDDVIQKFRSTREKGIMASWFYTDPDYRRTTSLAHLGELEVSNRLTEMISFFVIDSKVDIAFGGVRNNRSVNKLIEPTGCRVVKSNVINHGVNVDLVAWLREDMHSSTDKFPSFSHEMWNKRLVFESDRLELTSTTRMKKAA